MKSTILDKVIAERFNELGITMEIFTNMALLEQFFQKGYILWVRDVSHKQVDVWVLPPGFKPPGL